MTKQQTTETPTIVQDYRSYTAEEILRGILDFSESRGWTDPANLGHWLGAIQRWKERGGWISVKDRMPSTGAACWVVWNDHVQLMAFRRIGRGFDCTGGYFWETAYEVGCDAIPDGEITHWMPLPEPPHEPIKATEPLSPSPELRHLLSNWHHVSCSSRIAGGTCDCWERREALIAELVAGEC